MKCLRCHSKMILNLEKQWECSSCDFKMSKPHVAELAKG